MRPYVTTYYLTEVAPLEGGIVEDYLHPEWANVRFSDGGSMSGSIGPGELSDTGALVATGPTSHATRFRIGPGRYWGIGFLPLGWARFANCAAADRADRFTDALEDEAFAAFRPLGSGVFGAEPDFATEVDRIDSIMLGLLERPAQDEERILAIHAALVDPEVQTVAALADRTGLTPRSVERIARQAFGFPPKLLLRRQRFLRSLAEFMLDPSLNWLDTMDTQYFDQAHFIRDFHRFMDMAPTAYRALPHPILGAAALARAAAAGAPMQVLHQPEGGEPAE
ncbi:helix-turn-helix domain-containing protein [Tsuneonella mangrovi]|uniref:helix-turn-helix domain-containing protein n=1 Tax=Tsuneonella mangrovi TaxID=1982042 RepID=UPI001F0B6721|nr:helix-turn-helix domain-containing protein [Tsuneonella mangrovi]